ncbi:MAG: hypothetical protein AAFY91_18990, partial [Bacteroidota bacterium]
TFLNNVPAFSQEKQGMNIPLLIIQILFAAQDKRYRRSVEAIEAVEKYISRHLKTDTHYRSICFVRGLLNLPKAGFHYAAAKRYGQKYIDRLKEVPIEAGNQNYRLEPIPYERLWEICLSTLPDKRIRSSNNAMSSVRLRATT